MKSIRELRKLDFELSSTELFFSKIKGLKKRKIDFDVWLPSKKINLQRPKVWNNLQKQELIMSVFLKRYIPSICVASIIDDKDQSSDILQIIDGKQRLTTMIDFYNNEFEVELEGKAYLFKNLPKEYQLAYENFEIKCQMAYDQYEKRLTDKDKIDWFKLINFAGTPQDISHLKMLTD